MITEFQNLTAEESELLYKVPVLVSILVAGADSKIDKSEMKEAIMVMEMKPKKARKELLQYYQIAGEDFEDKLMGTIQDLPTSASEREKNLIDELSKLNNILPKIDKGFAVKFYESIKDLATKIAEASGGVFGFMAVGYEESKVIDLKMIKDPSKS